MRQVLLQRKATGRGGEGRRAGVMVCGVVSGKEERGAPRAAAAGSASAQ